MLILVKDCLLWLWDGFVRKNLPIEQKIIGTTVVVLIFILILVLLFFWFKNLYRRIDFYFKFKSDYKFYIKNKRI